MSKVENGTEFQYIKVPAYESEKYFEKSEGPSKYGYGVRHIQLLIFFICLAMNFTARGHLGVTLVAMTSHKNITNYRNINVRTDNITEYNDNNEGFTVLRRNETDRNVLDEIELRTQNTTNKDDYEKSQEELWSVYRTYDWPKTIQEMILSSFFLGYCLMMFPIAFVCQRWGGKIPFQVAMLVNGIASLMTPLLALWGGWPAVCVCRILQGLSQAGSFPAIQTLLSQWVHSSEKATLSSYVYTGGTVGTIIGFQLAGMISNKWGWPVTFWTIGVMSLITGIFLTIFGAPSPMLHKSISEEERKFLVGNCEKVNPKKRRTPWKAILTSKPVWGVFATHLGSTLTIVFFTNQVPSYVHYILGIDVKNSGMLSSLPYIVSFFCCMVYGIVSDFFTNRNIVSVKNARRIANSISQVGAALGIIGASYASSVTGVIVCFVVTMCCLMAIHVGWMLSHIDMAPNYSGTLMAIGNTMSNIVGLLMPVLVSNIVVDVENLYQWRIMLYMVAGMAFFLNLLYVFLVSTEIQPWNDPDYLDEQNNDVILQNLREKEKQNKISGR